MLPRQTQCYRLRAVKGVLLAGVHPHQPGTLTSLPLLHRLLSLEPVDEAIAAIDGEDGEEHDVEDGSVLCEHFVFLLLELKKTR